MRRVTPLSPMRMDNDWIDEGTLPIYPHWLGYVAQSGASSLPIFNTRMMRRGAPSLLTVVEG